MRRALPVILFALSACERIAPPDLGDGTDTDGETGDGDDGTDTEASGGTETASGDGDGDGDPGPYGWCCDCDLVPDGGSPICQPSYEETCGAKLVWCEAEADCYGLCVELSGDGDGDGDPGDGDGDGCIEPLATFDECTALAELPALADPPCCEPLIDPVPCMGATANEFCADSRRYTDAEGVTHWMCCPSP
jgi:hypothetical protein